MKWDTRTVALVAGTVVVLLLTVLGAAVGVGWRLEDRDFGLAGPPMPAPAPSPPERPDAAQGMSPNMDSAMDWGWIEVLGLVLFGVLAALALWWLWRWLRRRDPARRAPLREVRTTAGEVAEPDLPVLRRGVSAARRFLAQIPRASDAVIAAWLALEEAATESGVRRAPSQTPTEFTVAVLQRTPADPEATTELLALYHRARFSTGPIGADDVALASRCLARLAASWDVPAATDAPTS